MTATKQNVALPTQQFNVCDLPLSLGSKARRGAFHQLAHRHNQSNWENNGDCIPLRRTRLPSDLHCYNKHNSNLTCQKPCMFRSKNKIAKARSCRYFKRTLPKANRIVRREYQCCNRSSVPHRHVPECPRHLALLVELYILKAGAEFNRRNQANHPPSVPRKT